MSEPSSFSLNNLKNLLAESGVWEHIDELRSRLIKIVIGLVIAIVVSMIFADKLMALLAQPVGGLEALQSIEVTESITAFMRIALLSGAIIASPWIVYQLLAFILPGLESREKRWVFVGLPAIVILFLSGVAFTYFVMLPTAIPVLLTFMNVQTVPRVSSYIKFITGMMFWVGVAFQTPLLAFLLAKLGIISAKDLSKHWRIAIVAIAVAAALITPTGDPINMGLLMLPLTFLYGLSIVLARIARREKKET